MLNKTTYLQHSEIYRQGFLEVAFWYRQHLDIFLSSGYKQNIDLSEMSHLWNIWTSELFDQKCYSLSKDQFLSFPDSRKEKAQKCWEC